MSVECDNLLEYINKEINWRSNLTKRLEAISYMILQVVSILYVEYHVDCQLYE